MITTRRIDVGALVSSNSNAAFGLFDVAAVKEMCVYVQVLQVQAAGIKRGMPVMLVLPGRSFAGKVDTNSDAISAQLRALLVEALFDNRDGLLSPGAYAEAHLTLPLAPHVLTIPSASMISRNRTPEVATVKDNTVTLKPVTIILDTGSSIEVWAGAGRLVRRQPSDAIETGDKVRVERIGGRPVKEVPADASRHEAATRDVITHNYAGKEARSWTRLVVSLYLARPPCLPPCRSAAGFELFAAFVGSQSRVRAGRGPRRSPIDPLRD